MRFGKILGILAGAMLVLPASASASSIVYVCSDGANLCRVDPGNGAQTQLTADGQSGTSNAYGGPSLSRDGTKLAFVFNSQVIVSDANAANRGAPFATTAFVALMRPDGGAVAELEQALGVVQVCTYNLNGSGRNCPYGTAGSAGWAPDNNLLISVGAGPPNYNVEICHEPDQSNPPCASDPAHNLYDPAVAPDRETLAVTVADGSPTSGHIALYNYATGQFERNLTSGTADQLPSWSADGTQIAFQRGDNSVYVIGVNGAAGSEHQLVQGSQPTWGASTSSGGNGNGTVPNTSVGKPKIDKKHHRVTFKFSASGTASGFQCALVKLRKGHKARPHYKNCHSPKTYEGLAFAKYKFYVRAFNGAGHDSTPATRTFRL
jgi:Tol biopolymer transport system component